MKGLLQLSIWLLVEMLVDWVSKDWTLINYFNSGWIHNLCEPWISFSILIRNVISVWLQNINRETVPVVERTIVLFSIDWNLFKSSEYHPWLEVLVFEVEKRGMFYWKTEYSHLKGQIIFFTLNGQTIFSWRFTVIYV